MSPLHPFLPLVHVHTHRPPILQESEYAVPIGTLEACAPLYALPAGIDLAIYDCAVNQGLGRARRLLQQAAGVTVDGKIGPVTMVVAA